MSDWGPRTRRPTPCMLIRSLQGKWQCSATVLERRMVPSQQQCSSTHGRMACMAQICDMQAAVVLRHTTPSMLKMKRCCGALSHQWKT
eukprot:352218-Chlamydomonas_euryale.AAC.5